MTSSFAVFKEIIKETRNSSSLYSYLQNVVRPPYECFILGKHTARNGVAGISPPRREFQKC